MLEGNIHQPVGERTVTDLIFFQSFMNHNLQFILNDIDCDLLDQWFNNFVYQCFNFTVIQKDLFYCSANLVAY